MARSSEQRARAARSSRCCGLAEPGTPLALSSLFAAWASADGNGLGKPGLCVEGNLHVGEEALMEAPDAVRDASATSPSRTEIHWAGVCPCSVRNPQVMCAGAGGGDPTLVATGSAWTALPHPRGA